MNKCILQNRQWLTRVIKIYFSVFLAAVCMSVMSASVVSAACDDYPGLKRGKLYSKRAVKDFCIEVQQVIANTDAVPINVVHTDFDEFVQSKAQPWAAEDPYPGNDGPLTTHQYVTYGQYGTGSKTYPEIISCKVKREDALIALDVDPFAGPELTGSDINQATVEAVFCSLTKKERRRLVYTEDDVVIDPDEYDYTGAYWLDPWPYDGAYIGDDGLLHLQAKVLEVPHVFDYPLPGQYKGVHYIHLIAPEYVRALITGVVSPVDNPPPGR